jgi:hypothetical protein
MNSDTSASTETAADNVEDKGARKIRPFSLRLFVDVFALVLAVFSVLGYFAADRYYNRFGLSVHDLGPTEFDLILTTVPATAVIALLFWVLYSSRPSPSARARRSNYIRQLPQGRRRRLLEEAEEEGFDEKRFHFLKVVAVVIVLFGLYTVFGASPQDSSGNDARSTTYQMPKLPWLVMVPEPRWVEFVDAPRTCYALIGTHEGVWFLWDPTIPTLERHAVGQGVLKTCQPKP